MFGRRKKSKIKDQAWILLQDCGDIISAVSENRIYAEYLDKNPGKLLYGVFNVVGVCVYYVAGLNHVKTAEQMLECYSDMVGRYDENINPEKVTSEDAKRIINKYYQNARNISDTLMDEERAGIEQITLKHAQEIYNSIEISPSENDLLTLAKMLEEFYNKTYRRYYG